MSNSVPKRQIHEISFIGSFPRVKIMPNPGLPEFAFIGRSNVGKSSLINYISGRKSIAKTSSKPGKTQMINLFLVNSHYVIADLPGYGYAKVSKKTRAKWSKMITDYLLERESLMTVFLLIDSRLDPVESDIDQMKWMALNNIPFSLIFTKVDKLKPAEIESNIAKYLLKLNEDFDQLPNHFVSSSISKTGSEDILDYIDFVIGQA